MSLEDTFDKFCPPVIPTTKLPGKLKIYSTQSKDLDDKGLFSNNVWKKINTVKSILSHFECKYHQANLLTS